MTEDTEPPIEHEAEQIEYDTDLSMAEAIVIAGDRRGWSDEEIGRRMGRSDYTLNRIRSQLRDKKRELPEEIEKKQESLKVLREWSGDA